MSHEDNVVVSSPIRNVVVLLAVVATVFLIAIAILARAAATGAGSLFTVIAWLIPSMGVVFTLVIALVGTRVARRKMNSQTIGAAQQAGQEAVQRAQNTSSGAALAQDAAQGAAQQGQEVAGGATHQAQDAVGQATGSSRTSSTRSAGLHRPGHRGRSQKRCWGVSRRIEEFIEEARSCSGMVKLLPYGFMLGMSCLQVEPGEIVWKRP